MIEVRMSDEDEINRGQMMNVKAGLFQALDHFQPHRPDGIDQDIDLVGLNQKRGVTNPGDANLAFAHFWKKRARAVAGTLGEKRWDEDAGQEIAFMPIAAGTQSYPCRSFGAVRQCWANYFPAAVSGKRNRHVCANI